MASNSVVYVMSVYDCDYSENGLHSPSGVATGWHGWTMSRGPGAKGAPERETKNEKKRKKESDKEKKK